MRYAIVEDGTVTNVILIDDPEDYLLEPGMALVALDEDSQVGVGWGYGGEEWIAPEVEEPNIPDLDVAVFRRLAYQQEADPLFFKWQRGEAEEQDWLDCVREIRDRYPHPSRHLTTLVSTRFSPS